MKWVSRGKMDESFQKHKEKRISELHERFLNSKVKKKDGMKTFGQRAEKAWKNINEIKPKNNEK